MTDDEIGSLLAAQNEKLERIAVALESMVPLSERTACALEVAPALSPPGGSLQPPRRPGQM
jgi:hypothetical protein